MKCLACLLSLAPWQTHLSSYLLHCWPENYHDKVWNGNDVVRTIRTFQLASYYSDYVGVILVMYEKTGDTKELFPTHFRVISAIKRVTILNNS